jgi:purine-cytosine permease-like protein
MQGFLILNCIVGGQTLAAVSPDTLNATLGIVIIGVISLVVSRAVTYFLELIWV